MVSRRKCTILCHTDREVETARRASRCGSGNCAGTFRRAGHVHTGFKVRRSVGLSAGIYFFSPLIDSPASLELMRNAEWFPETGQHSSMILSGTVGLVRLNSYWGTGTSGPRADDKSQDPWRQKCKAIKRMPGPATWTACRRIRPISARLGHATNRRPGTGLLDTLLLLSSSIPEPVCIEMRQTGRLPAHIVGPFL